MRWLVFVVLIALFVGCSSKKVEKEEFKGLPFNPPDWSKAGYILDNNYSSVGISTTAEGVVLGSVDAASQAKEQLRKKIEQRGYLALVRLLSFMVLGEVSVQEIETDAAFLSAKIASESMIYFARDEIWFSPMGDIYQLYSVVREDLERIAAGSFRAFVHTSDRYSGINDDERIGFAIGELATALFDTK